MPTFKTPLELFLHQKASFEASDKSARQQWRQIPEGAFRDFKELTSGGVSSKTLALAGHPYARMANGARRGISKSYIKRNKGLGSTRGFAPLLPINKQSAKLHNSITAYHKSSRYTLEESVGFDAAKAGRSINAVLPKGSRYVVARGLWGEISVRGRARIRAYRDVFFNSQRTAFSKP